MLPNEEARTVSMGPLLGMPSTKGLTVLSTMLTNEEAGTEHGPTSGNALNRGALLDVKHNANK